MPPRSQYSLGIFSFSATSIDEHSYVLRGLKQEFVQFREWKETGKLVVPSRDFIRLKDELSFIRHRVNDATLYAHTI